MKKSEQQKQTVNEQPLTDAQKSAKLLLEASADKAYVQVEGLPIPYGRGVLVKKVVQAAIEETQSGLLLLQTETEKSRPLHIGIIHAVGPECSPFMKVGARIYYNFFVDSCFRFQGHEYYKMEESDVFYYIPEPNTLLMEGVKSDREVMRGKKQDKQQSVLQQQHLIDQNDLDKRFDKTKGKIKFMS